MRKYLSINVTNSICPKGWKMATSEVESDTDRKPLLTNGSFAYMLKQYGWDDYTKNDLGFYYVADTNDMGNIYLTPSYALRSGRIGGDNQAAGNYGRVWLSTACGNVFEGYSFATNFGAMFPAAWEARSFGLSL